MLCFWPKVAPERVAREQNLHAKRGMSCWNCPSDFLPRRCSSDCVQWTTGMFKISCADQACLVILHDCGPKLLAFRRYSTEPTLLEPPRDWCTAESFSSLLLWPHKGNTRSPSRHSRTQTFAITTTWCCTKHMSRRLDPRKKTFHPNWKASLRSPHITWTESLWRP